MIIEPCCSKVRRFVCGWIWEAISAARFVPLVMPSVSLSWELRSSQPQQHGFHLEAAFDGGLAQVTADSGLPEPAERQVRVIKIVAVQPDDAGAHPPGKACRHADVARPDAR